MKPLKVMSKTALAAVLATSVLVPTAVADVSANEVAAKSIQDVVFNKGEQGNLTLTQEEYVFAFLDGTINDTEEVNFIKGNNGEFYNHEDFVFAYLDTQDEEKALSKIKDKAVKLDNVREGKIENGIVVAKDEQPEDRLNETFFYNVA